MKKLIHAFVLLVGVIALLSNSEGRGTRSGTGAANAPGDGATCSNSSCHGTAGFNPSIALSLMKDGQAVDAYQPGEEYDMELVLNSSGANVFGFQLTAALEDAAEAGSFSDLADNIQSLVLNDRTYLEHPEPSQANVFRAKWTAPAEGSGDVTFYSAAIAANGNGNKSGDGGTSRTITLSEAMSSNTADLLAESILVYPNPTAGLVNIDADMNIQSYDLYNISGQHLLTGNSNSIDISDMDAGVYFLQINTVQGVTTKKISLVK